MDGKTKLSINFDEIHVIAREIVALRQIDEMKPSPRFRIKFLNYRSLQLQLRALRCASKGIVKD
jgi:hypothetical protein